MDELFNEDGTFKDEAFKDLPEQEGTELGATLNPLGAAESEAALLATLKTSLKLNMLALSAFEALRLSSQSKATANNKTIITQFLEAQMLAFIQHNEALARHATKCGEGCTCFESFQNYNHYAKRIKLFTHPEVKAQYLKNEVDLTGKNVEFYPFAEYLSDTAFKQRTLKELFQNKPPEEGK